MPMEAVNCFRCVILTPKENSPEGVFEAGPSHEACICKVDRVGLVLKTESMQRSLENIQVTLTPESLEAVQSAHQWVGWSQLLLKAGAAKTSKQQKEPRQNAKKRPLTHENAEGGEVGKNQVAPLVETDQESFLKPKGKSSKVACLKQIQSEMKDVVEKGVGQVDAPPEFQSDPLAFGRSKAGGKNIMHQIKELAELDLKAFPSKPLTHKGVIVDLGENFSDIVKRAPDYFSTTLISVRNRESFSKSVHTKLAQIRNHLTSDPPNRTESGFPYVSVGVGEMVSNVSFHFDHLGYFR